MEYLRKVKKYLNTEDIDLESDFKDIEFVWELGCKQYELLWITEDNFKILSQSSMSTMRNI
jgi:hypothetical protein